MAEKEIKGRKFSSEWTVTKGARRRRVNGRRVMTEHLFYYLSLLSVSFYLLSPSLSVFTSFYRGPYNVYLEERTGNDICSCWKELKLSTSKKVVLSLSSSFFQYQLEEKCPLRWTLKKDEMDTKESSSSPTSSFLRSD